MSKYEYLKLIKEDSTPFFYRKDSLKPLEEELREFLCDLEAFNTLEFATKTLFTQYSSCENERIGANLLRAYKYILTAGSLDKEKLKQLYSILSDGLLKSEDLDNMGDYYRAKDVYILEKGRYESKAKQDIPPERIDEFLSSYFDAFNDADSLDDVDVYVKSQILHFYFFYIHPYFDVNSRASKTLSMWYLLNNKAYPFSVFNRGILFRYHEFDSTIMSAKNGNDLTSFLILMLEIVKTELEKEYVIDLIRKSITCEITSTEYQSIIYFLSIKGLRSVFDFATFYNSKNDRQNVKFIYENYIVPLLDKGILDVIGESKKEVNGLRNKKLILKTLDVDNDKVKDLNLW